MLALHVLSHFSSAITMTKLDAASNDNRYNVTVYQRQEWQHVIRDLVDGQLYASLDFKQNAEDFLAFPRHIQTVGLCCIQGPQFLIGTEMDEHEPGEQCLVLGLPIANLAQLV